jgi:uncharacterized membrane protein
MRAGGVATNRSGTAAWLIGHGIALAALAGALWSHPAAADGLPAQGEVVTTPLDLLGKRIPLPPGDWKVVSAGYGQVTGPDPGPYGAIGGVLLLRAAPDSDHAFLMIHTNALPVRGGWGQPEECAADDALFQSAPEPRDLHNACTFIVVRDVGRVIEAGAPALAGNRSAAGLLPSWALEAGYRVSDRRDFVDVRYGVAPADPDPDGWFEPPSSLDEIHRALVTRLAAWAQGARAATSAALRAPRDQTHDLPPPPLDAAAGKSAAPAPAEDISTLRLAFYKTATLRIASTTAAFIIASALAGDLYTGLVVTAWQAATHSALYFANELAWEWSSAPPPTSFVAVPQAPAIAAAPPPAAAPSAWTVDGKQVPLPPGDWTLLAQQQDDRATGTILARRDGRTLLGLAVIYSNPRPTTGIVGTTKECVRSDIYFSVIRYDTALDGFCAYAKAVAADWTNATGLWGGAAPRLVAEGVDLPPVLMMVGARARTRENFLDVRYYFPADPASLAQSLPDQGLSPSRLAESPVLRERAAALQAWADLLQEPLEQGLRGRLSSGAAVLPWPWQTEAVAASLARQVQQPLRDLAAAGAIDPLALKRQLALADAALVERERQRWSLLWRSAYKVGTYRVLGYVDAVAVSWLVTASANQGFAYATINAVVQPILAYANELGWAAMGIGRPPAALLPVEFPEIGRDRL